MSGFVNTVDALGDAAFVDSFIDRSITEFKDDQLETVGASAFNACSALTTVDLPNAVTVGASAFNACSALTTVDLPNAVFSGASGGVDRHMSAFAGCSSLIALVLPKLTVTSGYMFTNCTSLKILDLPACEKVAINNTFLSCKNLVALLLRNADTAATLASAGFGGTPIASGTGYIYVPSALVEEYKAATNWSTYADQFRALEDYTVDGTVTGELDETKISEEAAE